MLPLAGLGLLLAGAAPEAAPEAGLPLWMVGEWCPRAVRETGPAPGDALNLRYERGDIGPGPHCIIWSVKRGAAAMMGRQTRGYFGRLDSGEITTISTARGELRLDHATTWVFYEDPKRDGRFREVSRGGQEIWFERIGRGSPWRIGYRREKEQLIEERVERKGGEPSGYAYTRTTR
jgi:hypothetical protein